MIGVPTGQAGSVVAEWFVRREPSWPLEVPVERVLAELADALGPGTRIAERIHNEARSTIYVIGDGTGPRWVVKRPRTQWWQSDLGSPAAAADEFAALQRAKAAGLRVPEAVALLPDIGAYVMSHVHGAPLPAGEVAAPARFVRRIHDLDRRPITVDLAAEVGARQLPRRVARWVGSRKVPGQRVLLHGDFAPSNFLVDEDGLIGLDIEARRLGLPEDDLARFLVLTSDEQPDLLAAYGEHQPVLLALAMLDQLLSRRRRLRQLIELSGRPALRPVRVTLSEARIAARVLRWSRRLRYYVAQQS